MARQRRERKSQGITLQQPDRSGPSEPTLLQLADERDLFRKADKRQRELQNKDRDTDKDVEEEEEEGQDEQDGLPPTVERFMDTVLYSVSLSMLHFTLDVLVQHQYAMAIDWWKIVKRTVSALFVFAALFYQLHPHPSNPTLIPRVPDRYQSMIRQGIFFVASIISGCYLIYITNKYSYLAVLKQAPSVGCVWVWAVIELNLGLATLSLACAGVFFRLGGYSIK